LLCAAENGFYRGEIAGLEPKAWERTVEVFAGLAGGDGERVSRAAFVAFAGDEESSTGGFVPLFADNLFDVLAAAPASGMTLSEFLDYLETSSAFREDLNLLGHSSSGAIPEPLIDAAHASFFAALARTAPDALKAPDLAAALKARGEPLERLEALEAWFQDVAGAGRRRGRTVVTRREFMGASRRSRKELLSRVVSSRMEVCSVM